MSKYYSSSIAFGAKQTKTEKVVVSPTKIGDVTTDAVSGALTVDEVPTLNSLNPVSSDGVARAVIQAGAELPTRGSEDTGKVLTVANSDGDLEWDAPETVTVDQTYDATSENAQSGTAVAEAVGTPVNLVQGSGITLTESSGNVTISADAQLPASTAADATKVLTVDSSGVPVWAVGGSKLTKLFGTVTNNEITGTAMPVLEPGYYQVNLMFDMTQYVSQFALIKFGVDYGSQSREMSEQLVPVDITSNGPFFTDRLTHIRTGYLEISGTAEGLIADFVDWGGNAPSAALPITTAMFYAVKIADLPY